MAEIIIVGAATIAVFSLFLAVMALKEKRATDRPPMHTCANRNGCQCNKHNNADGRRISQKSCGEPEPSSSQHPAIEPDNAI